MWGLISLLGCCCAYFRRRYFSYHWQIRNFMYPTAMHGVGPTNSYEQLENDPKYKLPSYAEVEAMGSLGPPADGDPYENFGPDRGGIRPDFGGNTVDRTKHQQNKNRAKKMSGSKLISQANVTLVSGSRQPHKTLTGTEQEPNNLKLLFQI